MSTKFNKLDEALNKLLKKIDKSPQDLFFFAANEARGILEFRVFNQNLTTDGRGFGGYRSEGHKKKRRKTGRQTSRKDLQLDSGLSKSIKVQRKKNNAIVMFNSNQAALIAEGQEKQIGQILSGASKVNMKSNIKTDIFKLSEKEKKEVLEKTAKQAIREIRKMIKESFK